MELVLEIVGVVAPWGGRWEAGTSPVVELRQLLASAVLQVLLTGSNDSLHSRLAHRGPCCNPNRALFMHHPAVSLHCSKYPLRPSESLGDPRSPSEVPRHPSKSLGAPRSPSGSLGVLWNPLGPLESFWVLCGPSKTGVLGSPAEVLWDPLDPVKYPRVLWDPLKPLRIPWCPLKSLGNPLESLRVPWSPLQPLESSSLELPRNPWKSLHVSFGSLSKPLEVPWHPMEPLQIIWGPLESRCAPNWLLHSQTTAA